MNRRELELKYDGRIPAHLLPQRPKQAKVYTEVEYAQDAHDRMAVALNAAKRDNRTADIEKFTAGYERTRDRLDAALEAQYDQTSDERGILA